MTEYGGAERRAAEEQRRAEDRPRRQRRRRRHRKKGGGLHLPALGILKWPALIAGGLLAVIALAGVVEPLMPWSRKAKLEAARDSLVVLEASRDSLGALAGQRRLARDSALKVARLDQEAAQASQMAAARLRSTNRTQARIITRLKGAQPAATPEGRIEQLEEIVAAQDGLIDSLQSEVDTLRSALQNQKRATAALMALGDSLQAELVETQADRDRYRATAIKFDEASGCGFPGNLIGCPSSTTVALLTAAVVVPLTLIVDRSLSSDSPVVVVRNDPEGYFRR